MFDKSSKYPIFIVYILLSLIVATIVAVFFDLTFVGGVFVISILFVLSFLLLDRYYNFSITNYKICYLLLDVLVLIFVLTTCIYNFKNHTNVLNILLLSLCLVLFFEIFVDVLFFKNETSNKKQGIAIIFFKLVSMISILTYFFKVSTFVYSIVSLSAEALDLILKFGFIKFTKTPEVHKKNEEVKRIENIIKRVEEGEID